MSGSRIEDQHNEEVLFEALNGGAADSDRPQSRYQVCIDKIKSLLDNQEIDADMETFIGNLGMAMAEYHRKQVKDSEIYDNFLKEICNLAYIVCLNKNRIDSQQLKNLNDMIKAMFDGSVKMHNLTTGKISKSQNKFFMICHSRCEQGLDVEKYINYCSLRIKAINMMLTEQLHRPGLSDDKSNDIKLANAIDFQYNFLYHVNRNSFISSGALSLFSGLSLGIVAAQNIATGIGMSLIASKLALITGAAVLGITIIAAWPIALSLLIVGIGFMLYFRAPKEIALESKNTLDPILKAYNACTSSLTGTETQSSEVQDDECLSPGSENNNGYINGSDFFHKEIREILTTDSTDLQDVNDKMRCNALEGVLHI